jgi:hypothetical protein
VSIGEFRRNEFREVYSCAPRLGDKEITRSGARGIILNIFGWLVRAN